MNAHKAIFVVVLMLATTLLFADGPETQLPTEVSVFTDQTVQFVLETLSSAPGGRASVAVAPFSTNGSVSPLGELLAVSVATRLVNAPASRLSVIDLETYTGALDVDYLVQGRVFPTETAVLAVVQILDGTTREILQGVESGFSRSSWVDNLLVFTDEGSPDGVSEDPYEPDSVENPYVLSTGEIVEGRVLSEADEDWYFYEVSGIEGQGLLTVGTDSEIDTYLTAFGPDNPDRFLAENDDYESSDAAVTVVVEPGQRVWFVVTGYDSSITGPYSLYSMLEEFGGDPLEPNDSAEEAVEIGVNDEPIGSILIPGSDVDWFSFELARSAGTDTIVSIETFGELDTYIELYDAQGRLLLENDDGGTDGNGRIDVFLSDTGRYYVKVRHYDGSDQGEFQLGVRLIQATPDEWEPDDNRQDARVTPVDGAVQIHNFTPADEVDWISFSIQATRTVEIKTSGNIDTYMVLYDQLGNRLDEDDDSGGDYNARIERVLQRGTYFVELSQVEGDAVFGGEYGLSVRAY